MCPYIISIRHSIDNTDTYDTISFILRTSLNHAFHTSWYCIQLTFHLFRKDQSIENYRQIFNKSIIDQFPRKDWSTIYITGIFSRSLPVQFRSLNSLFWFFPADVFPGSDKSLNDLFWFFSKSLLVQINLSTIYSDSFLVGTFSGSDKSLKDLLWFSPVKEYSRPLLVQFKSLNGLSWYFPNEHFSGSDKSLNDLFWFFPSRHFLWFR